MLDNQTISLATSLPKSRRLFVKLRWGGRICSHNLFREAIYDASLAEMEALSGELELDESLFGGKRKGKRGQDLALSLSKSP